MDYEVFEGKKDVQIIPNGEESFHYFDMMCRCCPKHEHDELHRTIVIHNSFLEGDADISSKLPFVSYRNKRDC